MGSRGRAFWTGTCQRGSRPEEVRSISSFSSILPSFPSSLPQANKPSRLSRNNVLFDQSAGETLHQLHSFPLSVALHQSLLCYILVFSSRTGRGPARPSLKLPADA